MKLHSQREGFLSFVFFSSIFISSHSLNLIKQFNVSLEISFLWDNGTRSAYLVLLCPMRSDFIDECRKLAVVL